MCNFRIMTGSLRCGACAEPSLARAAVVALTAFAMREDREELRAAGFDGYVSKPIEIRAFLEQVQQFCSKER